MMKMIAMLAACTFFLALTSVAQEEMTRDEWQQEMDRYTQLRNDLQTKVTQLTNDVNGLQAQSTSLDGDLAKCMDELYALVGSNSQEAAAYRAEIEAAEGKADELLRLSDTDLKARGAEVNDLVAKVKSLRANRLSIIPEFSDRLDALDQKVASLQKAVASEKWYTVGTWSNDRDCLWNIAKKPDLYSDAWQWPKIWFENKSQIRNPDRIETGQKLKINPARELTAKEETAVKRYYAKKR